MFISGRWDELKGFAFLSIKYHKRENLIFQHVLIKEKVINFFKNNRLEETYCVVIRNGVVIDTLKSFDIVEINKCGSLVLEVLERLFCHNMQYNPYVDFVNDMVAKRDLYMKQGKEFLQTLFEKINNLVYGGNIRRDVNEQFKCVTDNWMKENYDYRVKEW